MNKIEKWLVGKLAPKGSNAYYEAFPEEAPEKERETLADNLRLICKISEDHRKSFPVNYYKHRQELERLETIEEKIAYTKDLINTLSTNLDLAKLREEYSPSKEEKRALGIYKTWLKYFEGQKELIQPHIGVQTKAKPSPKKFADYLLCDEDRKPIIMGKLQKLLQEAKGKQAATILIALHKLGLLNLPERGKQEIYDAVNVAFRLSLKNQHYQRYIKYTSNGATTEHIDEAEIQQTMKQIK
jgi:hypothetical protein